MWNAFGRKAVGFVVGVAAVLVLAGLSSVAFAEEVPKKEAPKKEAPKGTLKLRAKSILFSRATGDLKLEGDVHVTRTVGGEVLTVECDKMTAKMKDDKMESVLATGNVKLVTADIRASSATADFNFKDNIITLRGAKDKPAAMTTLRAPMIASTGPTIIFHIADERVEMPDGGDTTIPIDSEPDKKKEK